MNKKLNKSMNKKQGAELACKISEEGFDYFFNNYIGDFKTLQEEYGAHDSIKKPMEDYQKATIALEKALDKLPGYKNWQEIIDEDEV